MIDYCDKCGKLLLLSLRINARKQKYIVKSAVSYYVSLMLMTNMNFVLCAESNA